VDPTLSIQQNVQLASLTTFRIGGPARYFIEIRTESELTASIAFAREHKLDLFVLGGGSNLLISDAGFNGLVLHMALNEPIRFARTGETIESTVAAGVEWDALVRAASEQGISGIECMAGIPGSVGGTPVQNVGAYGQEVSATIAKVRALDLETNQFVELTSAQCGFTYRSSIFNTTHRDRYIITAVTFRFDPCAKPALAYKDLARHFGDAEPTPMEVYHAVREIRSRKGMLLVEGEPDCQSAGSFFKNPVVDGLTLQNIAGRLNMEVDKIPSWPAENGRVKLPAAWLLEQAGYTKGFALGNVGISSRHALALINRGGATAAEIITLRDRIRADVSRLFGITLQQEPVQVPPAT